MDELQVQVRHHGQVVPGASGAAILQIGATSSKEYSLAQLDNYMHLPRRKFPCQPPLILSLKARISESGLPGTWGFGLWNDPISVSFGGGGMARFLPVLPNAAWFFYGSPENHLSLRDDLPAKGFHAGTFSSPLLPSAVSLFGLPFLPFLLWPGTARFMRRIARRMVKEDARAVSAPIADWHRFGLTWEKDKVVFSVDGAVVFSTGVVPAGRLGVVIWIDNQYMRFDSEGRLAFGFEPVEGPQTLEIDAFRLS
jgi:hypothetical protein